MRSKLFPRIACEQKWGWLLVILERTYCTEAIPGDWWTIRNLLIACHFLQILNCEVNYHLVSYWFHSHMTNCESSVASMN